MKHHRYINIKKASLLLMTKTEHNYRFEKVKRKYKYCSNYIYLLPLCQTYDYMNENGFDVFGMWYTDYKNLL